MQDIEEIREVRAIPTRAFGCEFRSRTEGRWATFYNSLKLPWEYEPQGYPLPSGDWYLPDFLLPSLDCYIEIKGVKPNVRERRVAEALAAYAGKPVYLFFDGIWMPNQSGRPSLAPESIAYIPRSAIHAGETRPVVFEDTAHLWCECQDCGAFGIQFDGRANRLPCKQPKGSCLRYGAHLDKGYNYDSELLMAAYTLALSARFDGKD